MKFMTKFVLIAILMSYMGSLFATNDMTANQSDSPIRIMLQWRNQPQFAGYNMAKIKGFYAEEGLHVEILSGGSESALDAIYANEAEFGVEMLSEAMIFHAQKDSIHLVAQYVNQCTFCIVAWKDAIDSAFSPIQKFNDLDSKRISLFPGHLARPFLRAFRKHKIQNVQVYPQFMSPSLFLIKGIEGCAVTEYNELNFLYQRGVDPEKIHVFKIRDYADDFPEDGLYCLKRYSDANPEIVKKIRRATNKGWEYVKNNPEETIKVATQIAHKEGIIINPAHIRFMTLKMIELIFPTKKDSWKFSILTKEQLEMCTQKLIQEGFITAPIKYEDFVNEAHYEKSI